MLDTTRKQEVFTLNLASDILEAVIDQLDAEYLCLQPDPTDESAQIYTPLAEDMQEYIQKLIRKQLGLCYPIRVVVKCDGRELNYTQILEEVNRDRSEDWQDYTLDDLLFWELETLQWIDREYYDVYLGGQKV